MRLNGRTLGIVTSSIVSLLGSSALAAPWDLDVEAFALVRSSGPETTLITNGFDQSIDIFTTSDLGNTFGLGLEVEAGTKIGSWDLDIRAILSAPSIASLSATVNTDSFSYAHDAAGYGIFGPGNFDYDLDLGRETTMGSLEANVGRSVGGGKFNLFGGLRAFGLTDDLLMSGELFDLGGAQSTAFVDVDNVLFGAQVGISADLYTLDSGISFSGFAKAGYFGTEVTANYGAVDTFGNDSDYTNSDTGETAMVELGIHVDYPASEEGQFYFEYGIMYFDNIGSAPGTLNVSDVRDNTGPEIGFESALYHNISVGMKFTF